MFHVKHRAGVCCSLLFRGLLCYNTKKQHQREDSPVNHQAHQLWYTQPAENWNCALPLGNGRMGAMCFGGAQDALVQLNEDTLWTGVPGRYDQTGGPAALEKARALTMQGQTHAAQEVLEKEFLLGLWSQLYQPLGDLKLHMHHGPASGYTRALQLDTAVHTVSYQADGTQYRREMFISCPDQALVWHVQADVPGQVSFDVTIQAAMEKTAMQAQGQGLLLTGFCPIVYHTPGKGQDHGRRIVYGENKAEQGVQYAALLLVRAKGGSVTVSDQAVTVQGADSADIMLCVRTSYHGWNRHPALDGKEYLTPCFRDGDQVLSMDYDALKTRHVQDHGALYSRMELDLGSHVNGDAPTDERLRRHEAGADDPALYTLLFNFGRYLTIAGSRQGTQAMNLQGIWNNQLTPPWNCNYTLNINTEMNYWPTLRCGLGECLEPLLSLIGDVTESGRITAKNWYGASGAVCHHNTDLWRMTTPVGAGCAGCVSYAYWPMGLGWLSRHAWEHYLYTGNRAALEKTGYPALKAAAEFFRDMLTEGADGCLAVSPGTSPEHTFYNEWDGWLSGLAAGTAMNDQIVRDTFENCILAAQALETDEDFVRELQTLLPRLRGVIVDRRGRVQEWDQDYPDGEIHHRHQSHLYAAYPASQISASTPDLMEAARQTLRIRGDEGTGWSLGWKINLWARLLDGEKALQMIDTQLSPMDGSDVQYSGKGGTYPNMLDAHPPFQIDGNFGAVSGILEMLCQVDAEGGVHLLPALPKKWHTGSLRGLHLPGGRVLDMTWEKGRVKEAVIRACFT